MSKVIAFAGKGGVGKTTVASLVVRSLSKSGKTPILAVDADPSPCLAGALGFPPEQRQKLHPISEMDDLIYERTGAKPGTTGGYFTLNPRVDDIPERFSVEYRDVHLLEMGSVDIGGSGCICPESAMLKSLFTHLLFRKDDVLILDMYAGVEHLGRATVDFVDAMLIVAEPTFEAVATQGTGVFDTLKAVAKQTTPSARPIADLSPKFSCSWKSKIFPCPTQTDDRCWPSNGCLSISRHRRSGRELSIFAN